MTDMERAARRQELEQFANAGGQPNQPLPPGHALVRPTASLTPIGAQPVAAYRDEAKVLQKLSALAAAAGSDWFYRFPVRSQDGSQSWIEGPSIKLANDIARVFGNCVIEVRELDVGDAFVFYARFSDIETGFSMERAFRQRKGQRTVKTKDADRQLDILYQIGQSKAIRNVIVNSLQIYSDYAFEQARNSLTEKIGSDIDSWRTRTLEGLGRVPVDVHRVERVIGRAAKDWLAPDIAKIVAMMRAIADGMATVDETWPPDQDVLEKDKTPEKAPAGDASAPGTGEGAAAAPADQAEVHPAKSAAPTAPTAPTSVEQYMAMLHRSCEQATDPEVLRAWFESHQQRRMRNGAGMISDDTLRARKVIDQRCQELGT